MNQIGRIAIVSLVFSGLIACGVPEEHDCSSATPAAATDMSPPKVWVCVACSKTLPAIGCVPSLCKSTTFGLCCVQ